MHKKFWEGIRNFVSRDDLTVNEITEERNLHIAMAALMVHAARTDDEFHITEQENILRIVREKLDLDDEDAEFLIHQADRVNAEAIDLYGFVRVINSEFDNEQRKSIVRMMWEVVLADGVIDYHERTFLSKVCHLMGVSSRDAVQIRHEVEQGVDPESDTGTGG